MTPMQQFLLAITDDDSWSNYRTLHIWTASSYRRHNTEAWHQ